MTSYPSHLLPVCRGTDFGDGGFARIAYKSGTDFLLEGAMGLQYRPSTPRRRALAEASTPLVQPSRGACQTYVVQAGDTIASVAYEHGVTPVGVLFENRPVLEDSGWMLGQDLPVGVTLSICNNRELAFGGLPLLSGVSHVDSKRNLPC